MKTKNICQRAFFTIMIASIIIGGSFVANKNVMSNNSSYAKNNSAVNISCADTYKDCSGAGSFINYTIVIFLALMIWSISPVGLLFFLASGALISKRSSRIKRTVAWLMQVLAFFTWISFMILLLVAFFDSISFNVFKLGGTTLELAVASGFGFFVVMFVLAVMEKGVEKEIINERELNKKKNNSRNDEGSGDSKKRKDEGNIKIAGLEFQGIKNKIRKKIKDDLKEIVDDVIERRP